MKTFFKAKEKEVPYEDYIRGLPCCLCGWQSLWDRCHVHHVGGDPRVNRRDNGLAIIPLCPNCHLKTHAFPAANREKLRKIAAKLRTDYESN